ncbi:conserved unknown protein [Ectocarpus siliculosus]|uniref:DNA polymerase delta small subunit n=1 Tax=Ectocarpus siliculosus TaxID=2880 RepID=D7FZB3_ECTSI|nr:conserved unknown protein [Ectocarpus siliculosus]|eukprot:CBJ32730.1 conserved unknown protein [Ectocarpus siliculosus]
MTAESERGADMLMSPPSSIDATAVGADGARGDELGAPRVELAYEPRYQRFIVKKKSFTQQFSHVYNKRLLALKGAVRQAAEKRWGKEGEGGGVKFVDRLVNMREGDEWVVIGTTYKAMKLRPSILNEFREDRGISMAVVAPVGSFTSEDDSLVLEDESGRVSISGPGIQSSSLVSGLVIAVKGTVTASGEMLVDDWCPAGIPPPVPPSPSKKVGGRHDPLLVSLLVDFVAGYLGGVEDQEGTSARIGRVIVCGDSVAAPSAELLSGTGPSKRLNAEQQRLVASPMKELDTILALLAAAAPVDVMPGESDPANYTLPQQPLHPCLLRNASRFGALKRVTNPHEAKIGERVFLGSSGQPLLDMARYTTPEAEADKDAKPACLRRLEEMLKWRHMAPTAPETLGCYPFVTEDPFVVEECPDIFFAGNQPQFATSILEGADGHKGRVVCVPAFAATGQAALLNLESLECTPLNFSSTVGGGVDDADGGGVKTAAPADDNSSPAMEVEAAAAD